MNYFVYPLKYMRITQNYNGTYSHKNHWYKAKDYKDYPIDDGGKDTGRDGIYCPCDEMIVTEIKGLNNNNITNTIWLVSTSKVITPTFNDYVFMTLTHSNDSDFKNIKVGTKFQRGQLIVKEGEDYKVATHIHMVFGRGKSNTWVRNSNNSIVIKGNTLKPEEVCFIDKKITVIKNSGGIKWVDIPIYYGKSVSRNTNVDQIRININNLRARKDANGEILGYINEGIYNYTEMKKNGNYVWYKIDEVWVAYSNEWADIFLKKEKISFWQKINNILKKLFKIV